MTWADIITGMARPCACGCGEMVAGTWKRGHHRRRIRAVPAAPQVPAAPTGTAGGQREWWDVDPGSVQGGAGVPAAGSVPGGPWDGTGTPPPLGTPTEWWDVPGPDPDPGYALAPGEPAPTPDLPAFDVSPKVKRDVAAMLGLFIMLPADLIIMIDPYCGDAFMKSAPGMVKAMVPIICQSEAAVEFIVKKAGLIMWANFFMAAKPFLTALIAHHVTKRVTLERDEHGKTSVAETDFSQYSAA